MRKNWSAYEGAARQLIIDIRSGLGADKAMGGAQWEVDARTWQDGAEGLVVAEVRLYNSPLKQEALAALAWRLHAGAAGVLAMSTALLPVAASAATEQLLLTDDITAVNYLAEFLSRRLPLLEA
jgi:hypothetical protein